MAENITIEVLSLTDAMRDRLERRCFAMEQLQQELGIWFKRKHQAIASSLVRLTRESMGDLCEKLKELKRQEIPTLLTNLPRGEVCGMFIASVLGEVLEMPRALYSGLQPYQPDYDAPFFATAKDTAIQSQYAVFGRVERLYDARVERHILTESTVRHF